MIDPISLALIIIALAIHEYAHALLADHLGDPTPRAQGRLTLNPLAHLDLYGTLAMVFFGFGWGKPVQIDPYNLKQPRRDELIIALAGPISNILLAIFVAILIHFFGGYQIFLRFLFLNLALASFNMLPLWPLDGSKVLINSLSFENGHKLQSILQNYSLPLLLVTMLPLFGSTSLVQQIINPIINTLGSLLLSF